MSSGTSTPTLPRDSGDLAKAEASGTASASALTPTYTRTHTSLWSHGTARYLFYVLISFSQTWAKLFPHLESLSPSLYFLILYTLAGTATLNCVFSLALFLFIWNKGELDLLIFQVSSEA